MRRFLASALHRALSGFGMKLVPSTVETGRTDYEPCKGTDWAQERDYWYHVLRTFYRSEYGMELAAAQSDDTLAPSPELVSLIQAPEKAIPDAFFASGYRDVYSYLLELRDYEFPPTDMDRILDFGVGLGRLIIHYSPFKAELSGCDVTKDALAWTKEKHGHRVQIRCTSFEPPLPYPSDYFDFVYANSVFTHIPLKMQDPWAKELAPLPDRVATLSLPSWIPTCMPGTIHPGTTTRNSRCREGTR